MKKYLRNHGAKKYQKTNYRGEIDQCTEVKKVLVGQHSINHIAANLLCSSDDLFVVKNWLYCYYG